MKKRLLSMLLVLVMVMAMLPVSVMAAEHEHVYNEYGGCTVEQCGNHKAHYEVPGREDGVCDQYGCTTHVHYYGDGVACLKEGCPNHLEHYEGEVKNGTCDHTGCNEHVHYYADDGVACLKEGCPNHLEHYEGEVKNGTCDHTGCNEHVHYYADDGVACLDPECGNHLEHYDDNGNMICDHIGCQEHVHKYNEYGGCMKSDCGNHQRHYEAVGTENGVCDQYGCTEHVCFDGDKNGKCDFCEEEEETPEVTPEPDYFVIEASSGRHGDVSSEGVSFITPGADKTYYFYPDKGYEVSAVYVDGKIVNYYGICIDHHWSCKGCDDCWWIDWSQWYDCEHKWCDHDDCGYWYNGHWYAYDKCDHWYDSCYWGTWENSITFYDVEDDHTLYVEFAKVAEDCASAYYWDLDTDAWYHEATDFVINKGLMKGVGGNIFDPYGSTTRGELVTMLYRLAGEPKALGTSAFADVAEGQWYTNAVIWAANKGIVTGYGDGTFGVEDVVTREQTVAILYRYAKWAGCDVSDLASLLNFVDADEVSEYAEKPFGWAVEEDVIEGKPVSGWKLKLDPQGITERVEMAAMLMRFAKLVD